MKNVPSTTDRPTRPIGKALIYLATEVEAPIETDFNRWAAGHLRENLALPGFLSARRLRHRPEHSDGTTSPTVLTLYDLTDLAAIRELESPIRDRSMPEAFAGRFRFSRSLFHALEQGEDAPSRQQRGPAILHITVDVEKAYHEAFLAWYVEEHVPAVLSAPGVLSVRRFENASLDADGQAARGEFRYLTIYETEDVDVVSRPETVEASMQSPCPAEIAPHRRSTYNVYEEFLTMEATMKV